MARILHPIARILLALIFVVSGIGKLMNMSATAGYMAKMHVPAITAALVVAIVIELGGGILVMLGWLTRWAAGIMFLYLIPVTWYIHRHQQVEILKNISIMGGLLLLVAGGAGACALDRLRAGKTA